MSAAISGAVSAWSTDTSIWAVAACSGVTSR